MLWGDDVGESIGFPPKGSIQERQEGYCTGECSNRTRVKNFELKDGSFRLDKRKKFFTISMMRHWTRFHREAVDLLSLEIFKTR